MKGFVKSDLHWMDENIVIHYNVIHYNVFVALQQLTPSKHAQTKSDMNLSWIGHFLNRLLSNTNLFSQRQCIVFAIVFSIQELNAWCSMGPCANSTGSSPIKQYSFSSSNKLLIPSVDTSFENIVTRRTHLTLQVNLFYHSIWTQTSMPS